jgi:hypothetical protein
MNVNVLVISGSMGSGKTTVLGEASDVLEQEGVAHAVIDLDAIATVGLPNASELVYRNLSALYENIRRAGLRHLLVAEAIETADERARLHAAMPGAALVICRLTADVATMERRLRVREPGLKQDRFVARAAELERILAATRLEDFSVENDARSVTAVARDVLVGAGWLR